MWIHSIDRKRHLVTRRQSLIIVIVSAACFGTLAVLTPLAYGQGATPLPLLAWRFLFASLLLGTVASLRNKKALLVPRSDLGRFAVLAIAGYGAASICFFFALKFADASVVAVLLYAYPAIVTVVSWLALGEKATWQRGAAVLVTFVGCALVVGLFGGAAHASWQGVALGLGAAVTYASFNLLSHRWLPGRSQMVMMTYTFATAGAMAAVLALVLGQSLSPGSWHPAVWWLLGVIVLVPTFVAIVLYLEGIRGLGPSQAAVVSTLEPLFTMVLAWFVLHERLTAPQVLGAVLVLAGVAAAEIAARMTAEPPAV
ncbi:MAG: EamA family transporter [Coriobacteriia bacterium]|nr:EamA family transporter [Coriobacteriia bacterium]